MYSSAAAKSRTLTSVSAQKTAYSSARYCSEAGVASCGPDSVGSVCAAGSSGDRPRISPARPTTMARSCTATDGA